MMLVTCRHANKCTYKDCEFKWTLDPRHLTRDCANGWYMRTDCDALDFFRDHEDCPFPAIIQTIKWDGKK